MKNWQKFSLAGGCLIITLANGALLAYASTTNKPKSTPNKTVASVIKKTADVKNVELNKVDSTEQGVLLRTGQYKYETLSHSKITTGDPAQLAVAANESSGGHFVLALLGKQTKIPKESIKVGWTVNSIANDPMWAPGACSSKPTFLIQGKYIFIDDGKTNPSDKYSSYIMFDMASGKYNYFGGNNFTAHQGKAEHILQTVNENDKLVFYIDPADDKGPLASNPDFKHSKGSDHGYIIRRVIDPATMKYSDYSLPFTAPTDYKVYTINPFYDKDTLITMNTDGPALGYKGSVVDNRISLQKDNGEVTPFKDPPLENALEKQLNGPLKLALPKLSVQKVEPGSPKYTTKFGINELGSTANSKLLIASQRFGGYDTPAIYNSETKAVNVMTDSKILQSYTNYVALGVF